MKVFFKCQWCGETLPDNLHTRVCPWCKKESTHHLLCSEPESQADEKLKRFYWEPK